MGILAPVANCGRGRGGGAGGEKWKQLSKVHSDWGVLLNNPPWEPQVCTGPPGLLVNLGHSEGGHNFLGVTSL